MDWVKVYEEMDINTPIKGKVSINPFETLDKEMQTINDWTHGLMLQDIHSFKCNTFALSVDEKILYIDKMLEGWDVRITQTGSRQLNQTTWKGNNTFYKFLGQYKKYLLDKKTLSTQLLNEVYTHFKEYLSVGREEFLAKCERGERLNAFVEKGKVTHFTRLFIELARLEGLNYGDIAFRYFGTRKSDARECELYHEVTAFIKKGKKAK